MPPIVLSIAVPSLDHILAGAAWTISCSAEMPHQKLEKGHAGAPDDRKFDTVLTTVMPY